jgi:hypothetical protein
VSEALWSRMKRTADSRHTANPKVATFCVKCARNDKTCTVAQTRGDTGASCQGQSD